MRLFAAINFTDEFKKSLLDYQNELKKLCAGQRVSWTRSENLHMTLAFIGEFKEPDRVKSALEGVIFQPFEIKTTGSGNFGALRWVGISDNSVKLAEKVRSALDGAKIPYDTKPFSPHVTVAREIFIEKGARLPRVKEVSMTVGRISLMKSERINGRLTYTEIYFKEAQEY